MQIYIAMILICMTCYSSAQNWINSTDNFIYLYGSNGFLSEEELTSFFNIIKVEYDEKYKENIRLKIQENNYTQGFNKCESAADIFSRCDKSNSGSKSVNASTLTLILPSIFNRIQNPFCYAHDWIVEDSQRNRLIEVWGYGLLMVTLINLCACLGVVFLPFMNRKFYKLVLTFMVALAVGSLAGSALLFLIPDAMNLKEIEEEYPKYSGYMWKATTIFGGIYMFFLLERFLKLIVECKLPCRKGYNLSEDDEFPPCSMNIRREGKPDDDMKFPPKPEGCRIVSEDIHYAELELAQPYGKPAFENEVKCGHNHSHYVPVENGVVAPLEVEGKRRHVAPVAWMIIFGDGVHNFIDGLSIGAAFSRTTIIGVSLSLAVLCEELPHELGDFAILLNSGMSMKKAMGCNFLSACMCYAGFAVGVLLGELPSASQWVFAVAGGMFLYISLVDMMPEINHAIETPEAKSLGRGRIFFLQNLGLLSGFGILLLLAIYGGDIQL